MLLGNFSRPLSPVLISSMFYGQVFVWGISYLAIFEIKKALSSDQIAKFKIGSPEATQFYNDENGTINQLATAENNWNGCHPRNGFQDDFDNY